jgi:murein L,D-transpeptidase YcbB/YkuD
MDYLLQSQPTDPLYRTLQRELTKAADKDSRQKIAVNMERCRWQMKRPAANGRHVLVNIPAQHLWAVCPDSVLDMRICCGAVTTKTPLLSSEITYMQVNPDWIIPQSIIRNDVSAHGGDSAYFARNRYYIVDRQSGDTLDPVSVTGDQMRAGGLRIGQKGGAGNSLGRIVFRFANNFGVYLHDTNNRKAFQRERRTLSHGCVRVQKPFELARFLLSDADDWTLDRIRISMDMRPESEQGIDYLKEHADDPRPLKLLSYRDVSPHVPVYIIYYTAYPNPATGAVEQWPDLYGYDKAISREMKQFLPR